MEDIAILSPGERLKKLRKILRLRQEELAGEKFSKNYISMFENNKRNINAINATYLAEQINELAIKKGKEIEINSSYFLKNDEDIAKEKCESWLNEVNTNLNLSLEQVYKNLSKAIYISTKYSLNDFKAKALYLKGLFAMQHKYFDCAMTHFLDAITFFALENDFLYIGDVYAKLGILLFKQENFRQALVYFNLAQYTLEEVKDIDNKVIEDINYYKVLCYNEMGQCKIAQNILSKVEVKNMKLLELKNQINKVSVI